MASTTDAVPGRGLAARVRHPDPSTAVIAIFTLVALCLRGYRLTRPHLLTGATNYDDGVYFGDAVRLVHGVLPYRDFVSVHPPLIAVLMAPLAWLGSAIGTASAFGLARIATVVVATLAVPLLGRLLRPRGPWAVTVGCALLALHPDAIRSGSTLLLEPWLVLLCLLGATLAFRGDHLVSGQRLVWAGAMFGLAGATKIWAIAPAAVLVVLLVRRPRELLRVVAGAAGAFVLVVAPFALVAPHQFVHQVLTAQLGRHGARTSETIKSSAFFGLDEISGLRPRSRTALAIAVLIGLALASAFVVRWRLERRGPTALEAFAAGSAVTVLAMFAVAGQFFYHYAGFFAPFLALAAALPVGRAPQVGRAPLVMPSSDIEPAADIEPVAAASSRPLPTRNRPPLWAAPLLILALVFGVTHADYLRHSARTQIADPRLRALIKPGACVVTNDPSVTLALDRFTARSPQCPNFVDTFGAALAITGQDSKHALKDTKLRRFWGMLVHRAQFVILTTDFSNLVPEGHLRPYLSRHFRLVLSSPELQTWKRAPPVRVR